MMVDIPIASYPPLGALPPGQPPDFWQGMVAPGVPIAPKAGLMPPPITSPGIAAPVFKPPMPTPLAVTPRVVPPVPDFPVAAYATPRAPAPVAPAPPNPTASQPPRDALTAGAKPKDEGINIISGGRYTQRAGMTPMSLPQAQIYGELMRQHMAATNPALVAQRSMMQETAAAFAAAHDEKATQAERDAALKHFSDLRNTLAQYGQLNSILGMQSLMGYGNYGFMPPYGG